MDFAKKQYFSSESFLEYLRYTLKFITRFIFMRLYVDTNVFVDYLTTRLPCDFFFRAFVKRWILVISSATLAELRRLGFYSQAITLLSYYEVEVIIADDTDKRLATSYKTHLADAIHIVLAQKAKCDAIITRNKRDFVESNIPVRGPNEKL